jgi:hypothetical protein
LGLVDDQAPDRIADALLKLMTSGLGRQLRENFLNQFTLGRHLASLAAAIREVEKA